MMVSLMFPIVPDNCFVSQELLSNGLCRCPSLQEALTAGFWGVKLPCDGDVREHFWHPWNATVTGIDRNFCYMKFFCFFDGSLQVWWSNYNVTGNMYFFWITLTFERDWSRSTFVFFFGGGGGVMQLDYDKQLQESQWAISQAVYWNRIRFSWLV